MQSFGACVGHVVYACTRRKRAAGFQAREGRMCARAPVKNVIDGMCYTSVYTHTHITKIHMYTYI